jgi:DNA-binding transcriptional LysR family regulator
MESQQLKHLVAAVHCGNLVKAADECNISQSGLSRSIKSLEDRLGVPLLTRKPKGVEPTVFGRSFVERAKLILNEIDRSVQELKSLSVAEKGEAVFGVTQNYGFYFIPAVLAQLSQTHPGVRTQVVTGGFLDLVAELKAGAIDFAFGLLGRIDESAEITVEPLRDHHSRVVARAGHPLAMKNEEVTPTELAAASWATLSGEGFQRTFCDYFFSLGLPTPVQALRTDSIALIRETLASTDFLAVLPPHIVCREVQAGELAILDCEAPAEQTEVGLIFRNDSLITPQAKQVVGLIRKAVAAHAPI